MAGFKFEDYRQPWETGPHWELKREFMEKYRDMFDEDRLLCLAQAYSNIVLMNCSYPDDVMRQISHLSKPLQMRRKFQEANESSNAESPQNQDRVSEKMKLIYQNSGRPFKQIKFCTSEEQTKLVDSSVSSVLSQNSLQENSGMNFSQIVNRTVTQLQPEPSASEQEETLSQKSKIISVLGLEFIKNYIQEIRKFQTKQCSSLESILNASQSLKISDMISFQIDLEPNCPPHAPVFCSTFSVKNCVISSEKEKNKKNAKLKSASVAVDILINIASQGVAKSSCSTNVDVNALGAEIHDPSASNQLGDGNEKIMDNSQLNQQVNSTEAFSSNYPKKSIMYLLQKLNERLDEWARKQHVFNALMDAAASLKMIKYIRFENSKYFVTPLKVEHQCKFFFKSVLISSAKDVKKTSARTAATAAGLLKLKNLSNYEIQNKQLVECGKSTTNEAEISANPHPSIEATSNKPPFILNQSLFSASMKDSFVLHDNLAMKPLSQRNLKSLLSESAQFCRKKFGYNFEDVPGTNQKKADVLIEDTVVGTGTSSTKDEAKDIACYNAVEMLRRKYYTIKVHNEYVDGFIITHNQVLDGESFSSAVITDLNIGCRMLKNMGWTGGGLGTSGIAEPVEAYSQHCFGRGLGYDGQQNTDMKLFTRRIHSMLQEYSKSNSLSDLIFSKEFSKEERKKIHMIAGNYKLHSASRGNEENRYLSVRRKYTAIEVLTYLANAGGSNSKFELVDASKLESFDTLLNK